MSQHDPPDCPSHKKAYPREGAARRAGKDLAKRHHSKVANVPYRCSECGLWHLAPDRNRRGAKWR